MYNHNDTNSFYINNFEYFLLFFLHPKTLQYLMGHSDIGVTMNTYTHLGLEDAKDEMIRMEELNAAKKELEKTIGEKPVTQKMFKVV